MSLSSRLNAFWKGDRLQQNSVSRASASVLCPGRNCFDVVKVERAAVLVDGADYFRHLESSLRQARRSIIIIGWDFDGRIRLRPQADGEESPPLGQLLRALVEANPQLCVHILIWSASVLHGPSAIAPGCSAAIGGTIRALSSNSTRSTRSMARITRRSSASMAR
ncbi:hypothetical protein QO058_09765 [Bosea vestrisii]|nr:hypothetical protein [Bosea vestrisii]WID98492.1 hypothetical protein QO058_09765 [Bosea vestrisii]